MLPLIERQARCLPLIELSQGILTKSCPDMKSSLTQLSRGFLLAAIGLTLSSLVICLCWRKVVKAAKKSKRWRRTAESLSATHTIKVRALGQAVAARARRIRGRSLRSLKLCCLAYAAHLLVKQLAT